MPGFESGAHTLHNILIGVTFVLAMLGIFLLAFQGLREKSTGNIMPTLVRLVVVVIMIGSLGAWGDLLTDAVNDVVGQMGLGGVEGGIFAAYRDAVARKFGSDGSVPKSQSQQQQQSQPTPTTEGDASLAFAQSGDVQTTHYGYAGDTTPDWNSAHGIGDRQNQLIATPQLRSVALTQSERYAMFGVTGVSTGNVFPYQGMTVRDDDTAPESNRRVDLFDPNNEFASLDGSSGGGGNSGPLGGWISKIGDSLTIGLLYPLVHLLSLIALGIMYLMQAAQQILYTIEIAISPIFIGLLMVPRLVGIATRFFCSLAAICIWSLGWAICDLLTRALIAFAVNPTNNLALSAFSGSSMMLGYWVLLAVWVIGSSFVAPLIISALLIGGGGAGVASVFGATVGTIAIMAAGGGRSTAGAAASVAAAPISAASHSMMSAYTNYARRPGRPQPPP